VASVCSCHIVIIDFYRRSVTRRDDSDAISHMRITEWRFPHRSGNCVLCDSWEKRRMHSPREATLRNEFSCVRRTDNHIYHVQYTWRQLSFMHLIVMRDKIFNVAQRAIGTALRIVRITKENKCRADSHCYLTTKRAKLKTTSKLAKLHAFFDSIHRRR